MIVERVTPPTALPFALSALKAHCRVDDGEFDGELIAQAQAAATELEAYAQLALIDQMVRVTLDAWPRPGTFGLPVAPVFDPLSVTITADGAAYADFAVITGLRPAVRITGARPCGVILITYEAGFGPAQTDIPADIVNAIMDQAAAFFDQRGMGDGKTNGMSPHMARIAARYRRVAV